MHPLSTNSCNESHSRKKGRKKLGYRFARYPCLLLSFPEILPISLSFRILYHSSNIVSILTHLPFPRSQLSNGQSSNSPPTIFSDTFLFLDTWATLSSSSSLHHCSFSSIAHSLFLPPPLSSFPRFYSSLSLKYTNIFDILSLSFSPSFHPGRCGSRGLRLSTAGSAINFRAPTPSNISLPFVRASSSFCRGPPVHADKRAAYYG